MCTFITFAVLLEKYCSHWKSSFVLVFRVLAWVFINFKPQCPRLKGQYRTINKVNWMCNGSFQHWDHCASHTSETQQKQVYGNCPTVLQVGLPLPKENFYSNKDLLLELQSPHMIIWDLWINTKIFCNGIHQFVGNHKAREALCDFTVSLICLEHFVTTSSIFYYLFPKIYSAWWLGRVTCCCYSF